MTPSRDPHHWKKDLTIEDICQFYSYVEHKEWNLDILFEDICQFYSYEHKEWNLGILFDLYESLRAGAQSISATLAHPSDF